MSLGIIGWFCCEAALLIMVFGKHLREDGKPLDVPLVLRMVAAAVGLMLIEVARLMLHGAARGLFVFAMFLALLCLGGAMTYRLGRICERLRQEEERERA